MNGRRQHRALLTATAVSSQVPRSAAGDNTGEGLRRQPRLCQEATRSAGVDLGP